MLILLLMCPTYLFLELMKIDDGTIETLTPALSSALHMSGADRKWIETLVNTITESWDTSTCVVKLCVLIKLS